MSGQVDDFDLVKLIETHPILFDKNLARGLKNATRKDEAWREISIQVGASERACITRWKSIRDRFGKEYRRVQEHPDEPTYWDLFPHLLFLKDHYKHGHAKNDCLETIKYQPKERKRRTRVRWGDGGAHAEEESNEEELDPEELIINQQLIVLVKEHPVLYDKHKIRDSKNLTAKNDAWRDISESLGVTEEICYKRWKKLRDRFSREYRNHQIDSEKPITWIYFQDLSFLESHYRKGIPLVIENLKRRGRPTITTNNNSNNNETINCNSNNSTSTTESPWGTELPYTCNEDEDEQVPEPEVEKYIEVETHTLDEMILVPPKQEIDHSHGQTILLQKDSPFMRSSPSLEPAEKLSNVISNIECVLRQSQDCLKSLYHQQQRHEQELQESLTVYQTQPTMIQKVQILLDGLNLEQRQRAERKILQFLCECQIKALNDEEIDDVACVPIF